MDQRELVEQLKRNPAALQGIMQSRDGQQLMQMLSGNDGGAALNHAASQASVGNAAEMIQMLKNVMSTPNGAALVQRIRDNLQK
ncbi:MAG: hypothetical protein KBS74_06595 [Clostridiales bacterium]|nr:hypothetical protein [Candidatus Cacconaster stercorequi]